MLEAFWEIGQNRRIRTNNQAANQASQKARGAQHKVMELEQSIDKLLLVNRAMWEIMRKQFHVDDETLLAKVKEIDLRDGYADGKLRKNTARLCGNCGRTLNRNHAKCLYCGSSDLNADPFDSVK